MSDFPEYTFYLKLTNDCQLHCKHCYNEQMHNKDYMREDSFFRSVQEIYQFQDDHSNSKVYIHLHGGEPMLWNLRYLNRIMWNKIYSRNGKVIWCVTTNLVYKLKKVHLDIFNQIRNSGMNVIQTSWDYDIRFQNDKQQELWLSNCQKLIRQGFIVQPTICLTNILIENIKPKDLFKQFVDWGFTSFNFERITNNGRAKDGVLTPSNRILNEYLLELYKIHQQQYSNVNIPLFDGIKHSLNNEYIGCRARHCSETVVTINPDGSKATCPNISDKPYQSGWSTIKLYNKQDIIKQEKKVDSNCMFCEYYQYCRGDCFQLQHDETGCPGPKLIYQYLLKK